MAQPIIINDAPARYRYAAGVAKAEIGSDIANGVANMFMAYSAHKDKEREDTLKTQLALAKEFGFKAFGEPFAKSMESTVGRQLFPRDPQGNIILPKTEQEQQDEELAKHYPDPEQRQHMWEVAHKLVKADPSPLEIKVKTDIEDRRDQRQREKIAADDLRSQRKIGAAYDLENLRWNHNWHNKQSPFTLYKGVLVPYDQRTLRKDPGATPLTMGDADFVMKYNKYSLDRKGAQLRNAGQALKNEQLTQKMLEAKDDVMLEVAKQAKPVVDIAKALASKGFRDNPQSTKLVVSMLQVLLRDKVDKQGNRKYSDQEIQSLMQDSGFIEATKEVTSSWFTHIDMASHSSGGLLNAGQGEQQPAAVTPGAGSVPLDPTDEANSYLGGK